MKNSIRCIGVVFLVFLDCLGACVVKMLGDKHALLSLAVFVALIIVCVAGMYLIVESDSPKKVLRK
jgi:hypothetical protein